MVEPIQEVANVAVRAADNLLTQGVLGTLLVLSLVANVVLVYSLVKCWKTKNGGYYDVE